MTPPPFQHDLGISAISLVASSHNTYMYIYIYMPDFYMQWMLEFRGHGWK